MKNQVLKVAFLLCIFITVSLSSTAQTSLNYVMRNNGGSVISNGSSVYPGTKITISPESGTFVKQTRNGAPHCPSSRPYSNQYGQYSWYQYDIDNVYKGSLANNNAAWSINISNGSIRPTGAQCPSSISNWGISGTSDAKITVDNNSSQHAAMIHIVMGGDHPGDVQTLTVYVYPSSGGGGGCEGGGECIE